MGRSKSVPSRRQETGTIVGAAALANSSSSLSLASPSHLSARNNDRRLAISGASSVEEVQHPPSTLAMGAAAEASGQQERVSPTSPARSRSSDDAAASSASAIVTPEKEGKKSVAKRKSRSATSGDRPRLRRVAFADTESLQGQHTSRDTNAAADDNDDNDDDDSALFDEAPTCGQGGGISGRMIIDDDDVDIEGGTSSTPSDVRRRIYFDEEDEEEGDIEKKRKEKEMKQICASTILQKYESFRRGTKLSFMLPHLQPVMQVFKRLYPKMLHPMSFYDYGLLIPRLFLLAVTVIPAVFEGQLLFRRRKQWNPRFSSGQTNRARTNLPAVISSRSTMRPSAAPSRAIFLTLFLRIIHPPVLLMYLSVSPRSALMCAVHLSSVLRQFLFLVSCLAIQTNFLSPTHRTP